jgi:hypothetical protein
MMRNADDGYPDSGIANTYGRLRVDLASLLSQRKRASAFGTRSTANHTTTGLCPERLSPFSSRNSFDRQGTKRVLYEILTFVAYGSLAFATRGGERAKKKKQCARMVSSYDTFSYSCYQVTARKRKVSLCDGL